jgi:hypothetical protein
MKKQIGLSIMVVVLMIVACIQCQAACSGTVYSATAALKGVGGQSGTLVGSGTLANRHLINIALEIQESEQPAPPDMLLALISNCQCPTPSLSLVVWNTQSSTIAATIAIAQDIMGDRKYIHNVDVRKTGQSVILMTVQKVGHFNGGYLSLVSKYSIPTTGCISKETINVSGYMNADAYDTAGNWVAGMDMLILSGTIKVKMPALGSAPVE